MSVSAQAVKQLRERTGVGMMECKRALQESNGDMDKAVLYLRERGLSRAAQKSSRAATEGLVATHIDATGQRGAIVEVSCETDFVSKNEEFSTFAQRLAELAAQQRIAAVEALAAAKLGERTVQEQVVDLISKIGENISIKRVALCELQEQGFVSGYVHLGGKLGTLVGLKTTTPEAHQELGRDLALQIVASAPRYLAPAEVSAGEIAQEKEIAAKKLRKEGKPDNIIPKIIEGQINKFYNEVCLLNQPHIKEPKTSVSAFMREHAPQVEITGFVRFQVGV